MCPQIFQWLMPNHFHLVRWPHRHGDLSRWMPWGMTSHGRRFGLLPRLELGRVLPSVASEPILAPRRVCPKIGLGARWVGFILPPETYVHRLTVSTRTVPYQM